MSAKRLRLIRRGDMISRCRLFALLLFGAGVLCGCSLVSGSRPSPVSETDREQIRKLEYFLVGIPLITQSLDGRPVELYTVAFDGTMNDRAHVPDDERKSIVAHISEKLNATYYPGPGMQNQYGVNYIDAVTGTSCRRTAQKAIEDFFQKIQAVLVAKPNTDVRVFVTGFSRGAATSRHFMNLAEEEWNRRGMGKKYPGSSLHFYALLFDTVATGQMDNLKLSLPVSLDYLIHLVAKDEVRHLFQYIADEPDMVFTLPLKLDPAEPQFTVRRINVLEVPGSHSDIGTTYKKGIGDEYRVFVEQILHEMGLIDDAEWALNASALKYGKHDSRGGLDLVLGRPAPNSAKPAPRQSSPAPARLTDAQCADILTRLNSMLEARLSRPGGYTVKRSELLGITLQIRREQDEIVVNSCKVGGEEMYDRHLGVTNRDGKRFLDGWYIFLGHPLRVNLRITDSVWETLGNGENATLSCREWETEKGSTLVLFLNDMRLDPQGCAEEKSP